MLLLVLGHIEHLTIHDNPEIVRFSDLFGLAPIWSGRLAPLCIGCGSGDFAAGVAWI